MHWRPADAAAPSPRLIARLGLRSPSTATTRWPARARSLARVPARVVLPTPPLPAKAMVGAIYVSFADRDPTSERPPRSAPHATVGGCAPSAGPIARTHAR